MSLYGLKLYKVNPCNLECESCERKDYCAEYLLAKSYAQSDAYYKKLHDESLANRGKYFIGDNGHWQEGDWRRVKKDSLWTEEMRKFCCYSGYASHKNYLHCKGCKEYAGCELGKLKYQPTENLFEKFADLVEKLFKR